MRYTHYTYNRMNTHFIFDGIRRIPVIKLYAPSSNSRFTHTRTHTHTSDVTQYRGPARDSHQQ